MCAWFPLEPLLETWAPKRQSAPLPSWVFCQKREHRAATESLEERHSMFLEWWNITKSLSNIWQVFSCLLPIRRKYLKNWNLMMAFIPANQAHLEVISNTILKNIIWIVFFARSCNPLINKTWKMLLNVGNNFYCIPTVLKHMYILWRGKWSEYKQRCDISSYCKLEASTCQTKTFFQTCLVFCLSVCLLARYLEDSSN